MACNSHAFRVMASKLQNKKIAILATDGFEQIELDAPKRAYLAERAEVDVVAPDGDPQIRGWASFDWGEQFRVDAKLGAAKVEDYDALLIPGGLFNPDALRRNREALAFVRSFFDAGKPVAAICHGPWVLIDAGVVEGRKLTSFPSIRTDLENAGARWVDEQVVCDGKLVTSRSPDDMEAFLRASIDVFAQT